ncbi:polysaccharide deacetylase [Leptospira inadai serovar Lyme str. 10]|uniref:Polysaccharide deacetylase n=2 Tax=Leptospira inadai serovar Lyme TaxID=293084 RepID=V6HVT9_9LEPT|nr:polysaccharide deacetylase family protein [Leptospira inadai]EQA36994.1 polysaccharide deacetylase [Leptospira inadai serovar Lyme str. 10]PNV75828.1 polysaccharide deacetylase [Leptospira inadai serovar Lyme]
MSFLHQILAASYLPLKSANSIAKFIKLKSRSELRVLLYHDIASEELEKARFQIKELSKTFRFISPEVFSEMVSGKISIQGKNLLLTFDDGFISNRNVAEQILNPLGIKALFFIVSDFVDVQGSKYRKEFIAKNIYPDRSLEQIPDSWGPMNWDDLRYLIETGHTIGSHTRNHARLSKISDERSLYNEIVTSKEILQDKLNITIKHFAYTFGDLDSFSESALKIAKTTYPYIYTGLRGNNIGAHPWAIRRDAVSPEDSFSLVGALLEGGADILYRKSLRIYESWVNQ